MATQPLAQDSHHQAQQQTLLIASSDQDQRAFLAAQLDADGHAVYETDDVNGGTKAPAWMRKTPSTRVPNSAHGDHGPEGRTLGRVVSLRGLFL